MRSIQPLENRRHAEPPNGVDHHQHVGGFDAVLHVENVFGRLGAVETFEIVVGQDGIELFRIEVANDQIVALVLRHLAQGGEDVVVEALGAGMGEYGKNMHGVIFPWRVVCPINRVKARRAGCWLRTGLQVIEKAL
jgi:hypothetical protein